jgi:hypothetical protein
VNLRKDHSRVLEGYCMLQQSALFVSISSSNVVDILGRSTKKDVAVCEKHL